VFQAQTPWYLEQSVLRTRQRVYTAPLRLILFLLLPVCCLALEPARLDTSTDIGRAFARMYNFDFAGAHRILDEEIAKDPRVPLPYSVKAAAHLFSELHRLKILQMEFFEDDDRVVERKKLTPDPAVRAEFDRLIAEARRRAAARLAVERGDRDAMFAECMAAGLVTDYAALVERRRLGSFSLAKKSQAQALKLLDLKPPVYDAYLTVGAVEYVVGSMPFFIRWFVHIERIEGSKEKAVESLQLVAERGRYYGPFARILLSVIHLREQRMKEAENLLRSVATEFPENPLFHRELKRISDMRRANMAASGQ
jgi:hypothetical protein